MSRVLKKGTDHPQNTTAYPDTVADYSGSSTGDNTIENVTCDSSVAVGDVVRMSGTTAVRAQADSITNANAIGICVSKSGATTCDIQVCGFTTSIFVGLSINTPYFLSASTAGALTTIAPTGSGEVVYYFGKAYTSSQFVIEKNSIVKRS